MYVCLSVSIRFDVIQLGGQSLISIVAHHIITGLKVAVKILNKGKIKHMEMAEKVRREINILKMCTHPHIIRLYVVEDSSTLSLS